ncbi:capsule assembly Wzi family protein [Dyadobacter pollutisoli]|jgi:hypothetical protein|uniref:Capsule assembly Wzi family protein n=1 Tax=Dyadobacter pollutisoli TaxID=2910158 RepID=A0A9E8SQM2_9BACT|nr:capsule assembly Wzi family protein [Dyadobacter pollutisoli]WAC13202.1 capsule assembly Wzi family protein [Dyadobacter pollutisoli]
MLLNVNYPWLSSVLMKALAIPVTLSFCHYAVASSDSLDSTEVIPRKKAWVEVAGFGATGDRTPFWLHVNQWGVVPTSGQIFSVRAGLEGIKVLSVDTTNTKWSLVYGTELIGNLSENSKVLIPQLYGGINYKGFQVTVGRWKQFAGICDPELGTGSYMWSGNALPMPKLQFGFLNYTPLIKNFLYFKGFYSDGLFENGRPVTSELKLHNKALYIRLGRPYGKVKLYGGFNHAVQWGGKSPYNTVDGRMPRGLSNYWYVITGFKPKDKQTVGGSNFDNYNRVGNHVASLDVGLELGLSSVEILMYRQHLIEDGSLFYLNNIKDGLNGISFKWKGNKDKVFDITKLTLELLYTKSQGGSEAVDGNQIRGKDDYFNNAQVRDGWSYYDRGIGTPFITATGENGWPKYADFFTNNNRVWVTHMGMKGKFGSYIWMTKLSLSSNQGTYDQPFPEKEYQFSGLFSVSKPVKWFGGSTISASIASDNGTLFKNSAGAMLSIRKNLLF